MNKDQLIHGKLYSIWCPFDPLYDKNYQWHDAYYVGENGDGDPTFHVKNDTCRYESYDWSFGETLAHIREIERPRKVSGWVNVYKFKARGLFATEEEADEAPSAYCRLACIYVSGEEGKLP